MHRVRSYFSVKRIVVPIVCLYAVLLIVGPIAAMILGSLQEGASAFWVEITRPQALAAFQLTAELAVASTAINTIFGVLVAWVLVRDNFVGRRFLNGLVDLPFAISPVIAGLMLILLFGRTGWLTPISDFLGVKLVFSWPGMLLATVFVSLPFVIREVVPVLSQLGVQHEQAAFTMGASAWQAFRHVTFSGIRWGLFYGISLTLARCLGEFGAVLVVSGGVSGLTETSTLYIFRSLDDRNYVGAYSSAFLLALVSFSILILMEFLKRRKLSSLE